VVYDFGELDELSLAFAISVHKCVAGYGRAAVHGVGLVPVADVGVGQLIQTGRGGYESVLAHIATGEKPIIRVRTRWGYTIDVSQEHPLLVASPEDYPHFRRAGELRVGMFACINRQAVEGRECRLPAVEYDDTHPAQKRLSVPEVLTPEFAWALGVIVGDGCYRNRRDGMIDVTNQDRDLIDRYRSVLEPLGLHVGVRTKANQYRVYFISRPLRRWLKRLGLGYALSPDKRSPAVIWQAPAGVRAGFLRGLFDADGSVGDRNVRFTSASRELVREVHDLLLSLGIVARVHSQGPRHHKVCVSSTALALFRDRVGFGVERKALALDGLVERLRAGKTNLDVIPFGRKLIGEYSATVPVAPGRKGLGRYADGDTRFKVASDLARGVYRMTYAHLRKLAARAKDAGEELPEAFRSTLETNYFYDEVVAVEQVPVTASMFDLEVAEQHSFTVNGFVCHNSQGAEYAAVVIPVHTQHYVMLQRNLLYTGITRGKQLVALVGTRKALARAVQNADTSRRYTLLAARLRAEAEKPVPGPE
jgi:intein/homing endonuclease